MRRPIWVLDLLAILAFVLPAKARDETPKAEVYVGYDYVRLSSGGTAFNFHGGSGQLDYNVSDWLGVAGDLGGYYTSNGFHGGTYLFGSGTLVWRLASHLRLLLNCSSKRHGSSPMPAD